MLAIVASVSSNNLLQSRLKCHRPDDASGDDCGALQSSDSIDSTSRLPEFAKCVGRCGSPGAPRSVILTCTLGDPS